MASTKKNFWRFRPLLTETLPYELPVIFGNDRLYYSKCRIVDPIAQPLLEKIYSYNGKHTIPYNYTIRKDSDRVTQLSLVHPHIQLEFCKFYEIHESSLLDYCNRSEFSLRYPSAVAAVYVLSLGDVKDVVHKTGEVHLAPDGAEPELAKMVSYFSYEKFNLLNKFYESSDFIRLEKKFEMLRHLDISKCFYSIYTHSIAWAIKNKEFAKNNIGAYSFESNFDSLMQRSNYNETNGIVVGPEFSRVFAEIILQDIDRTIQDQLKKNELVEGRDYSIRRYVDDYSVFANSEQHIERIDRLLRVELAKYKLYVNESKVENFRRPFVSNLTQARDDVRLRMDAISVLLQSDTWRSLDPISGKERQTIGSLVHDLRIIVRRNDVRVSNLSGSLIGSLRTLARLAKTALDKRSKTSVTKWMLVTKAILDCAFYLVSVDLRVRTTYGLCQLIALIQISAHKLSTDDRELIFHKISEELCAIIVGAMPTWELHSEDDSVEISNLLICGVHLLQDRFTNNGKIEYVLEKIRSHRLSYFKYITLKYCYLSDPAKFENQLLSLNTDAASKLTNKDDVMRNSELFHLLCDFLGAPDVPLKDRRTVYERLWRDQPSSAALDKLREAIGFTDWSGTCIEHSLKRRQMRPVYAVA